MIAVPSEAAWPFRRDSVSEAPAWGTLAAAATALDLRLIFAVVRAADQVEAGAWRRALELGIDSLARR